MDLLAPLLRSSAGDEPSSSLRQTLSYRKGSVTLNVHLSDEVGSFSKYDPYELVRNAKKRARAFEYKHKYYTPREIRRARKFGDIPSKSPPTKCARCAPRAMVDQFLDALSYAIRVDDETVRVKIIILGNHCSYTIRMDETRLKKFFLDHDERDRSSETDSEATSVSSSSELGSDIAADAAIYVDDRTTTHAVDDERDRSSETDSEATSVSSSSELGSDIEADAAMYVDDRTTAHAVDIDLTRAGALSYDYGLDYDGGGEPDDAEDVFGEDPYISPTRNSPASASVSTNLQAGGSPAAIGARDDVRASTAHGDETVTVTVPIGNEEALEEPTLGRVYEPFTDSDIVQFTSAYSYGHLIKWAFKSARGGAILFAKINSWVLGSGVDVSGLQDISWHSAIWSTIQPRSREHDFYKVGVIRAQVSHALCLLLKKLQSNPGGRIFDHFLQWRHNEVDMGYRSFKDRSLLQHIDIETLWIIAMGIFEILCYNQLIQVGSTGLVQFKCTPDIQFFGTTDTPALTTNQSGLPRQTIKLNRSERSIYCASRQVINSDYDLLKYLLADANTEFRTSPFSSESASEVKHRRSKFSAALLGRDPAYLYLSVRSGIAREVDTRQTRPTRRSRRSSPAVPSLYSSESTPTAEDDRVVTESEPDHEADSSVGQQQTRRSGQRLNAEELDAIIDTKLRNTRVNLTSVYSHVALKTVRYPYRQGECITFFSAESIVNLLATAAIWHPTAINATHFQTFIDKRVSYMIHLHVLLAPFRGWTASLLGSRICNEDGVPRDGVTSAAPKNKATEFLLESLFQRTKGSMAGLCEATLNDFVRMWFAGGTSQHARHARQIAYDMSMQYTEAVRTSIESSVSSTGTVDPVRAVEARFEAERAHSQRDDTQSYVKAKIEAMVKLVYGPHNGQYNMGSVHHSDRLVDTWSARLPVMSWDYDDPENNATPATNGPHSPSEVLVQVTNTVDRLIVEGRRTSAWLEGTDAVLEPRLALPDLETMRSNHRRCTI